MRRRRSYSYWRNYSWSYPTSKPKEAKGGIKAASQRGAFAQKWWAQRWISVLESFDIGARLSRGKSYARNGQVLSIEIEKGRVKAKVQGSRATPYKVSIEVKPIAPKEWAQVIAALAQQPLFVSKLLAGEMPDDIEYVFHEQLLSLFPSKFIDLKTECSCPDWSNPCKHIAAVFYLMGEEFDRDPFMIFLMRGLRREELLERLLPAKASQAIACADLPEEETASEPLPGDEQAFWHGGDWQSEFHREIELPPVPAALPRQLGNFPFWQGRELFMPAMESFYSQAGQNGLRILMGEADDSFASEDTPTRPRSQRK